MADYTETSCSYCDSQHTQYDYALHKVSNAHVKKVQRSLMHRGFSSVCLVCSFALKSLRQAELHVQEKTHTERMKFFLVNSYLSNDKCTCDRCGIAFFNEVALEAHCVSYPHDAAASPPHTRKLDELSRLLGGLHGQQFMSHSNHSCRACITAFDRIEDSIMHLFTASHIYSLRSSSCMVCKKEFSHTSDRELHVNSPKHMVALQKCGNLLEQGRTQAVFRKGGYPCMLCMLWCNSWFCFELHLLDKHHAKMTAQSTANRWIPKILVSSSFVDGSGQTAACDQSIMRSWRHWQGAAAGNCIWCHRCGNLLNNIDEVKEHLDKHDLSRSQRTSRLHWPRARCSDLVSESFGCSVCELSFKNPFMLSAHEASFEHHSRLAGFCLTDDVLSCSNCGLLMHNEAAGNSDSVCKEVQGSSPQKIRAEVSPKCLQSRHHHPFSCDAFTDCTNAKVLDSVAGVLSSGKGIYRTLVASGKGNHRTLVCADDNHRIGISKVDDRDNLVKAGVKTEPAELLASFSGEAVRNGEFFNRGPTENGVLECRSSCTSFIHNDNNVSSQLDGSGHFLKSRKGHLSYNLAGDGKSIVVEKRFATLPRNEKCDALDKAYPGSTNGSLSEVSLPNVVGNSPPLHDCLQLVCSSSLDDDSVMQQRPVLFASHVSDGDGSKSAKKTKLEDRGVPIVVAATLAPLGILQECLQSITAVVTKSLAYAVSDHVDQSTGLLKRKSGYAPADAVDQPDLKRACSEKILEAALHQSLHSVCSNASELRDLDAQRNTYAYNEKLRQSVGNDETVQEPQAIVAMAASIIPNGMEDFSRPAGSQGHVVANKVSCALQSGDEQAQELTDTKRESLSHGVEHDQGSAGINGVKTVGEEKLTEVDISCTQRSFPPLCGAQNRTTSMPVYSLAEGAVHSKENAVCLAAAKDTIADAIGVVAPVVSEERESDDDDDFYAFLDPSKAQCKWWSSSDSEESDSVSE